MATLTIRGLDTETTDALKARAAASGRSMEAEVRAIIRDAVAPGAEPTAPALGSSIRERFSGLDPSEQRGLFTPPNLTGGS